MPRCGRHGRQIDEQRIIRRPLTTRASYKQVAIDSRGSRGARSALERRSAINPTHRRGPPRGEPGEPQPCDGYQSFVPLLEPEPMIATANTVASMACTPPKAYQRETSMLQGGFAFQQRRTVGILENPACLGPPHVHSYLNTASLLTYASPVHTRGGWNDADASVNSIEHHSDGGKRMMPLNKCPGSTSNLGQSLP